MYINLYNFSRAHKICSIDFPICNILLYSKRELRDEGSRGHWQEARVVKRLDGIFSRLFCDGNLCFKYVIALVVWVILGTGLWV